MERFSLDISDVQVDETCSGDFLKLKLYAISDGVNNNNSEFTLESFDEGIKTIPNKPILAYYNSDLKDVEEHNSNLNIDEYGEIYEDYQYSYGERPVGLTPESSNIYIEFRDGRNWIVIENALIWTVYNHQLANLLKEQKSKKVSVEVEVLEKETVDGIDRYTKWNWCGITILGKLPDGSVVHEGIEGAHLELVEFSHSDKFKTFKEKFASLYNESVNKRDILLTYGLKEKANMAITVTELNDAIYAVIHNYTYMEGEYQYYKYWIRDIILDDNVVILTDEESGKLVAIPYSLENSSVSLKMDELKDASMKYVYSFNSDKKEVFLSKKEWGTGSVITVDKETVSKTSWGEVNKTELRNKVLKAKNYKSLVKSVYLLVEDGWEDAPASHLKYPVMQIKGSKAVYNAGGLLSAQQYGEKYDKSVARKAKRIRSKLGLTDKERSEKMTKFIEFARDNGYIYIGTMNNKLMFIKEDEKCEDKACESVEVYEMDCDKAKCADVETESEFVWDTMSTRDVKLSEDDDKDDKDDDEDDKEKESLKKELEDCKAALAKCEDELKTIRMEQMKTETEAVLEAESDKIDKESCDELRKMRDEGKFATVEDFTKELAYRKYVKESKEKKDIKKNYATFSVHNPMGSDNNDSKSIFDKLK